MPTRPSGGRKELTSVGQYAVLGTRIFLTPDVRRPVQAVGYWRDWLLKNKK
jgi:hypothetical protein